MSGALASGHNGFLLTCGLATMAIERFARRLKENEHGKEKACPRRRPIVGRERLRRSVRTNWIWNCGFNSHRRLDGLGSGRASRK